ncbi:MAG: 2,3-bisphosphoglycerate-independent phosphoglycerate mutase [Planctomycetes bacterium]|nr:2,3-bisphosphoglycerate-independent phosphoglycerate mutase [Planctomycetota bacterium]
MDTEVWRPLLHDNGSKIVFLVMDGLGGLPREGDGSTELEAARTPNLDSIAPRSALGLFDPVGPGITPGSGPGHFALFGYDPVENTIGRGMLSAMGLGFDVTPRDLTIRCNFATLDREGRVADRRAGRISTEKNRELCTRIARAMKPMPGVEVFLETEAEHRALLVLRGDDLHEDVAETDPGVTGELPVEPTAKSPSSRRSSEALVRLLAQVREILRDEPQANFILLRGYARFRAYPSMRERYGLRSLAVAGYPMYLGISRLLGMDTHRETGGIAAEFDRVAALIKDFDFAFCHVKKTDSTGEDGNFDAKVHVIEEVDAALPKLLAAKPDVLVVAADHSTPSRLRGHSWHPVPVLLYAATARYDRLARYTERQAAAGSLGRGPLKNVMLLAVAHAGRLKKFGA